VNLAEDNTENVQTEPSSSDGLSGGLTANCAWRASWMASRVGFLQSVLFRAFCLAVVWWVLTGGTLSSWLVGAPAVLLATLLSVALQSASPNRYRLMAVCSFIAYFLLHSLRGGLDVAWRSCDPRLPITPRMLTYRLRLPENDSSQVLFAGTLNLLPGTLTAEIQSDELIIHLLTDEPSTSVRLARLEELVGRLFDHQLTEIPARQSGESFP